MGKSEERRRARRVLVAERMGAQAQAALEIRILDLSAGGARIGHLDLLRPGLTYALKLPTAMGGLSLSIRVVRSAIVGTQSGPGGERLLRYESGVAFVDLTAEQRTTLQGILDRITPAGGLGIGLLLLSEGP